MKQASLATSRELIGLLESQGAQANVRGKPSAEIERPELIAGLPELPAAWTWASPAQIAAPESNALTIGPFGSNLTVSDYRTEGVPLVFVRNIRANDFERDLVYVTPAKAKELESHSVTPGDVLITKMGDPPGDAVMYPSNRPKAIITADCIKLRVSKLLDAPSFFVHAIHSRVVMQQIAKQTGGVAQQKVSLERFRSIAIPFPPLPEQRKIADILTTWDEALTHLDDIIEAQERRKKALMQQLLTGRRRLKGFSKPWKRFRFSELLEAQDRYVEFDDDHTYSLVSIRRRSGGVFFREALQGGDIKTKVMKRVHAGDFLISRMQVVHGALGMVRSECDGMYASDSYDVLVAKNQNILHMPFLDWMSRMRSFWHLAYISSHGVHIEKMTFKLSDFMHEKITLPNDIEEQRQIATILDTADQQLTLLRTQRTALDQQKRGLMQRLLTGKLRVTPKSI